MARTIDNEAAYRFLSEQLVKETGAFSKGVNKGLNIARSAMRNPDAIPTLTPPNEWVSVEEAMPPEHETVLCIVSGKPKPNIMLEDAYQLGSWNKADGWIIDEWLGWEGANVTWWMPLPASPDKDNNVPTKAPNEPLSLEQLREMDGEPVWVVPTGTHEKDEPMWCVLEGPMALIPGVDCWSWGFDGYGETWMAYRRPPEGET